ncbi:SRPBCC family protein [Nocardia jejuensis]|uniref:SRPBCC family protein n=1 Tax=Nocardia jejuensis TaxID=328049 RepID=UPI000832423A|nr:SRPBCC family protein [Nocardia jejuensis]
MVHVHNRSVVAVPVEFAFAYAADFGRAAEWIFGISALEVRGDIPIGLGAVYRGSMKLGPKTLHSTIEVVDWQQDSRVGTDTVEGFVNRSKWLFEPVGDTKTAITVDIDYELPGGLAGRALGIAIEPFVAIAVRHSDRTLKEILERDFGRTATPSG